MRRAQPEAALQREAVHFLRLALPGDETLVTCFPAGGGGPVRGAQLKAMGLMAGFPDLIILWRRQFVSAAPRLHFIGVELKSKTGRLSPEQIRCHFRLAMVGAEVLVVRSVEELERGLRALGVPLKATMGRAA